MIEKDFYGLMQNRDFNDNLISLSGKSTNEKDINNDYVIANDDNTFCLRMSKRNKLKPSNRLFITMLLSQLTEYGAIKECYKEPFVFTLEDYTNFRGIAFNKARTKIKDDLDALFDMSLEIKSEEPKQKQSYVKFRIIGAQAVIKMNKISLWFTPQFLNYYATISGYLKLPKEIFKIDVRYNPNTFDLFWKLAYHYNVNTNSNKDNKNKNVLSVKTLLKYCCAIPKYDENLKKAGGMTQRIINPFIRDMNAINIIDWYFLDRNNQVVAPEDIKHYEDFIDLKVHFDWKTDLYKQSVA